MTGKPNNPVATESGIKKKPYRKPTLTNFGSVVRLTQGGAFIGNEGNTMCDGNANPVMACELS